MFQGLDRYNTYKDARGERSQVPAHWRQGRLKDVARLVYGDALPAEARSAGEVPVMGSNGPIGEHSDPNTAGPTIVIGRKGSHGKVHYSNLSVWVMDTAYYIDARSTQANLAWLTHLLRSLQLDATSRDSAVPGLDRDEAHTRRIPIPPAEEQVAIAKYLGHAHARIDKAIAAKRKMIALLEEQKQAVIHQAVTRGLYPNVDLKDSGVPWLGPIPAHWESAALRFKFRQSLGKMLDSKRITGANPVRYLRNTDVQWDEIRTGELPTMDIAPEEFDAYTVRSGDVLVCEGGEVGRAAIWRGDEPLGFQKALHRLRPLGGQSPEFLVMLLKVAKALHALDSGRVSTIAHLTGDQLRALRLPWPPIEEQFAIVERVEAETSELSHLQAKLRQETALLTEFRARLTSDVVTGQVDVRAAAATLPDLAGDAHAAAVAFEQESLDEVAEEFLEGEPV